MKRFVIGMTMMATLAGCNAHPVSLPQYDVSVERQQPTMVPASEKLDLLWVIDNSGSMCQEQAQLRQNFDRFIDRLGEAVVDVHIGVTTTHMSEYSPSEPVARPGHLQSTPQPAPHNDSSCWKALNDDGEPIEEDDYSPIRDLLAAAVACMEEPDESLLEVSGDEIAEALAADGTGESLFPDPSSYRELPKVLKSKDYRKADGTLAVGRLKADFACMSLVGMRGHHFEKGLGAAVAAVSPELTGGTATHPINRSAPNHGFIRDDARFAAIFVTDENDCTHDGSLSEKSYGGDHACEFWNHPDLAAQTPLIAPEQLRDDMFANLAATKSQPGFDGSTVRVASIHGRSVRYDGSLVPAQDCRVSDPSEPASCDAFSKNYDRPEIDPTCASSLGAAKSGDRYERFLRSFGEGRYYPSASTADPQEQLTGWMCTGNFQPALVAIAEFLRKPPQGCISTPIQTCEPGAGECPTHASGEPGSCVPRPNSDQHICDSYVQMRVTSDAEQRQMLEGAGLCEVMSETGECIVSPDAYTLGSCSGGVSGVRVEWADENSARQALAGTELETRWVSTAPD